MSARVFQTFGGTGIGIETEKGCVKISWEETPVLAHKLMLLANAHAMVESVAQHNDQVAPLPPMITTDPEEFRQ